MEESYAACKYLKWISFIFLKSLLCVQCEPNFYSYFVDLRTAASFSLLYNTYLFIILANHNRQVSCGSSLQCNNVGL